MVVVALGAKLWAAVVVVVVVVANDDNGEDGVDGGSVVKEEELPEIALVAGVSAIVGATLGLML